MGLIIGFLGDGSAAGLSRAYHAAFLFPVAGLAAAIVLYLFSRDYWERA
jgi:hypothetical protein